MIRRKNEPTEIPFIASFKDMFTITDDLNLLLNGIEVYSCVNSLTMGNVLDKPVNFDIRIINGKKVIYPLECADSFLLHANRLFKERENSIEEDLQNYIYDLCDKENISIDLRFACYGDANIFYEEGNKGFHIMCEHYHVNNLSEVKNLIVNTYIFRLWQHSTKHQMIALYISDVINTGNGYNVIVGGQLIKKNK